MSRIQTHAISLCLIGTGVLACAFAGRSLIADPDLNPPLNPLGINGSPYGEVFAMAMQGPIDTYSEIGMYGESHHHPDGEKSEDHDHDHDHADGETCDDPDHLADAKPAPAAEPRFEKFLASLQVASQARTNPYAASEALKRHLRRQAEDKLRFAYQLDPAHYGNYNTLHFFLTEPSIGTRPQLTTSTAKLAEDTIQYCLKQENDPRPALTAAAAATNILQLMFEDARNAKPNFHTSQMRQFLSVLDYSLARYETIAKQWDQSKNWKLLSNQRVLECDERFDFISKIRDTSEKTILRLESKLQPQVSRESKDLKISKS
jgi:hypothetical protein